MFVTMRSRATLATAILLSATYAQTAQAADAASPPFIEHVQALNTRTLTFTAPASGSRIIRNISCIFQVVSGSAGTPVLSISGPGGSNVQVIYFPMVAAGAGVFINTTPIFAYVNKSDSIYVELGGDLNQAVVQAGCTLTG